MTTSSRPTAGLTNWAGNIAYRAAAVHEPASIEALQEVVRNGRSLRALGSRHAFNDLADTTGDLVSLDRMPRILEVDAAGRTVTIDGAMRYGDLCGPLDAAGFALPNLASLPHISVAGACATATHGSGDRLGTLASAVLRLEVVRADGERITFARDRDPDAFAGAVVALGGLGVVTHLTLAVEPTYRMRQDVYEDLPLAAAIEHFDEITTAAASVSLFTEWRGPTIEQIWCKRRILGDGDPSPSPTLFGATLAKRPLHPIRRLSPDACTEQLGTPGAWFDRLPHFRMDHTPSAGDELQSEYLIPRAHAPAALLAIDRLRDRIAPLLLVSEIRTVAADDLWMSTAFGRASAAIHFTWRPVWDEVRGLLPAIEAALAPFDPRPHWGKLSTMSPDAVRASYPRAPEFQALLAEHDPNGTFRNAYLDRYLDG